MADCVFCRIVAGEIPSTKVYEDAAAFAFADTNPQAPTHVLVVPKRHLADLGELAADPETSAALLDAIRAVVATGVAGGLPRGLQHRRASRAERLPRARARASRAADGLAAGLTGGQLARVFDGFAATIDSDRRPRAESRTCLIPTPAPIASPRRS